LKVFFPIQLFFFLVLPQLAFLSVSLSLAYSSLRVSCLWRSRSAGDWLVYFSPLNFASSTSTFSPPPPLGRSPSSSGAILPTEQLTPPLLEVVRRTIVSRPPRACPSERLVHHRYQSMSFLWASWQNSPPFSLSLACCASFEFFSSPFSPSQVRDG